MNIQELTTKIQECLTPDLLKKPYREKNKNNPMYGHCYVATEALYHSLDDRTKYQIQHGKDHEGVVHWWLREKETGEIVDVTSDQYYSQGLTPPYNNGRNGSFLTNFPSKRAVTLMERIK